MISELHVYFFYSRCLFRSNFLYIYIHCWLLKLQHQKGKKITEFFLLSVYRIVGRKHDKIYKQSGCRGVVAHYISDQLPNLFNRLGISITRLPRKQSNTMSLKKVRSRRATYVLRCLVQKYIWKASENF